MYSIAIPSVAECTITMFDFKSQTIKVVNPDFIILVLIIIKFLAVYQILK
jgi:hypothetical protein